MAHLAASLRQTDPSAGVWRHPPRPTRTPSLLRELTQMVVMAVAGALATGILATLILMSGPARAEGTQAPDDGAFILRPLDLIPPPVCACILPPFGDD